MLKNPHGVLVASLLIGLALLTVVTDPDHFTMTDLMDIGHFHHEQLVVFLLILAVMAIVLPAFIPPAPILYTLLAGAALVVVIGSIDLLTGWT